MNREKQQIVSVEKLEPTDVKSLKHFSYVEWAVQLQVHVISDSRHIDIEYIECLLLGC